MGANPPGTSPTGMKTHHWGMVLAAISAAATAAQGSITTVNLGDPTVWSMVFGFGMTIVGLIRNQPQGSAV